MTKTNIDTKAARIITQASIICSPRRLCNKNIGHDLYTQFLTVLFPFFFYKSYISDNNACPHLEDNWLDDTFLFCCRTSYTCGHTSAFKIPLIFSRSFFMRSLSVTSENKAGCSCLRCPTSDASGSP